MYVSHVESFISVCASLREHHFTFIYLLTYLLYGYTRYIASTKVAC